MRSSLALPMTMGLLAGSAWGGVFHPASSPDTAVPGRWLVLLSGEVAPARVEPLARSLVGARGRVERTWSSALRGFLVRMPREDAAALATRGPVIGVYQDVTLPDALSTPLPDCSVGVALAAPLPGPANPEPITCADPDPQNLSATCTDNWGLDRLDGTSVVRNGSYAPPRTGRGVHLFLVDTGLYAQHQDFAGRVGAGTDATGGGGTPDDCGAWSHGTHVAGIAAGAQFGVAKGATLHPVRVSPCPPNIQLSSLVTAFDWIAQAHAGAVPGPAVASMSINSTAPEFTDPAQPLGVAVAGVIAAGVLVLESAGNNLGDACGHVLGVPGVLIVGGSDEFDTPWERTPGDPNYAAWCGTDCGSNTGSCVDLFAPAAHIVSSWYGATPDPRNTCRLSGTSMASPHAAGAAALYLEANPAATPAQVKQALLARAQPVLTQLPAGSPNKLLSVLEGAPGVGVAPSSVGFGAVAVGATSNPLRVSVTSTGTLDLHVGAVALGGAMGAEFQLLADGCSNHTLAPAAACTIDLAFRPAAGGARSASLAVPSDDPARAQAVVPLSGTGELPVLRVDLAGAGSGTVSSSPVGIECGASCSAPFSPGTALTLTATPAAGAAFVGWSAPPACTGSTAPCSFTLDTSLLVVATFGVAPVDAGAPDAGAPDAGAAPDAGSADGGVSGLQASGGCGCGAGGVPLPFLLALLAALSWRRGAAVTRPVRPS